MGILEIIKKNKEIRKIFGQRELVIIEKQLLGVKLKPSEKTRLSRDIRKKFEMIKALSPFIEDFPLKQGAIIKEKIKETKEAILESKYFPQIKKIILFGSAAERQLTLSSDIDMVVEFFQMDKSEVMRFKLDILKKIGEKIEIQVYNFLPDKIKKEIDLKGKVLYERKDKR